MDSPIVVLENSLGFLYVPPRLELFLPVLLLHHQILSPETLQLSYSSNLVALFNKNWVLQGVPIHRISDIATKDFSVLDNSSKNLLIQTNFVPRSKLIPLFKRQINIKSKWYSTQGILVPLKLYFSL